MQQAYIIHKVPRFFIKNKALLSGEKKYYLNDLGFRNYLYPNLVEDIASILENIVYLHLRKNNYTIKIGYGRDYEIDFYIVKENEVKYIQVTYLIASNKTKEREFGALKKIKDHFPKYVLSMDDLRIQSSSGIKHESVWDFLYNLEKHG